MICKGGVVPAAGHPTIPLPCYTPSLEDLQCFISPLFPGNGATELLWLSQPHHGCLGRAGGCVLQPSPSARTFCGHCAAMSQLKSQSPPLLPSLWVCAGNWLYSHTYRTVNLVANGVIWPVPEQPRGSVPDLRRPVGKRQRLFLPVTILDPAVPWLRGYLCPSCSASLVNAPCRESVFSTVFDSGRLYKNTKVHKLALEMTGKVNTTVTINVRLLVAFSEL